MMLSHEMYKDSDSVCRIISEWDLGVTDYLFDDEDLAWDVLERLLIENQFEETIDELIEQGLVGVEYLTIHTAV